MSVLKLNKNLEAYLDKKLKDNPIVKAAVAKPTVLGARQIVCEAAKAMVGFKEKTGKNDGEQIVWVQDTYGNSVGEPYCISGVMTCVAYAALKTGLSHKLFETESSSALWDKTPKGQRVKKVALAGAIAVWQDINSKGQRKGTGHGEIVLSDDGIVFHCVGFNTSGTTKPGQTVNREGNGVYYTVRSRKNTKARIFMGFLKPF